MRESVPGANPPVLRGLPAGLLGALALCFAAECLADRLGDRFTTVGAAAWGHASAAAGKLPNRGEGAVLGFGDSLVKHGVLPAVLERRLGKPAYNLAVPWGQAPGHDFLLRRVLGGGARPAALLIDGELLGDDPTGRTRVWPELIGIAEAAELAASAGDPDFLAEVGLARLLPTFRLRADFREGLKAVVTRTPRPDAVAVPVHRRNWRRNLGAEPLPLADPRGGPDPRDREIARAHAEAAPEDWSCHPLNAAYVERFLGRAGARGVPVFWLLPPYHPGIQVIRRRNGRDAALEAFVRGLAARHPHLHVLDARDAGYPPDALADLTHLNRKGAAAYSAAVADLIADRLSDGGGAGRWLTLPRWDAGVPAEVEAAVALEDIGESGSGGARPQRQ